MKTPITLTLIALIALAAGATFVACDDDDDDDDNDAAVDDDDDSNSNTNEEDPCITQAKLDAQAACESAGSDANLSHIGLDAADGLDCYYYCSGYDYYLDPTCLGGACICCTE